MFKENLIFKILVFLSFGVIFNHFILDKPFKLEWVCLIFSLSFTIFLFIRKHRNLNQYTAILILINVFISGVILPDLIKTKSNKTNYISITTEVLNLGSYSKCEGLCLNGDKVIITIDSGLNFAQKGSQIKIYNRTQNILDHSIPGEFNYKEYLINKGIYHKISLYDGDFEIVRENLFWPKWFKFRDKVRKYFNGVLEDTGLDSKSISLMQSLVLADRSDLDKNTYNEFKTTGIVHVLAVSGLHVGMIALFLSYILGFIRNRKPILYCSIIISILILYAAICGFSDSILRATIMFSILQLAQMFSTSRKNSVNALLLSGLIIIILDSYAIFNIGFQLSFCAVLGLLVISPVLKEKLPSSIQKNKITELLLTSIVAQLSVLPLIMYNFGEFPTYFLLGNLIAIPIIFIAFPTGLSLLLLGWIPFVPELIGFLLEILLLPLYKIIQIVKNMPHNLVRWKWDGLSFIISLALFFSTLAISRRYSKKLFFQCLIIGIVLMGSLLINETTAFKSDKIAIKYNWKNNKCSVLYYHKNDFKKLSLNKITKINNVIIDQDKLINGGEIIYLAHNIDDLDKYNKNQKVILLNYNYWDLEKISMVKRTTNIKLIIPKIEGVHWVEV
jgi:competence protein ComEC